MLPKDIVIYSLLFNSILCFLFAKKCFHFLCEFNSNKYDDGATFVGESCGIFGAVFSTAIGMGLFYLAISNIDLLF